MTDNIDLLAGKIAELADKLSGPGVATAVEAMRVDAYSALSGGVIGFIVAGVSFWGARKMWAMKPAGTYGDDMPSKMTGAVLYFVFGIALFIGVWAFADPWTWTTILHPEVRLAKKLLGF